MKYNVLIVGVGGQGVLLASRVLGEAALRSGEEVVMSEVHGMAQRGGSVTSVVRFGEGVISPLIPLAGADVILGFEPLETYRAMNYAHQGTTVITDLAPILPTGVVSGKEVYPAVEDIVSAIRHAPVNLFSFDASGEALRAGSKLATNSVLLGALCGSGALPLEPKLVRAVLLESVRERSRDMNGEAFDKGFEHARGASKER